MNNRYLFRGKRTDNGEWLVGNYHYNPESPEFTNIPSHCVFPYNSTTDEFYSVDHYAVNPETVGQCTGLTDKNGLNLLFEYDIINANGEKVGNYYDDKEILKDGTNFVIEKLGTSKWRSAEQEAIKRGCFYAE